MKLTVIVAACCVAVITILIVLGVLLVLAIDGR